MEEGGKIIQETRTWDEKEGITKSMRSKEEANDYRYFPEPDLVPFTVSKEYIEEIRKTLPELPDARKERYMRCFGLSSEDAVMMTMIRIGRIISKQLLRREPIPKPL